MRLPIPQRRASWALPFEYNSALMKLRFALNNLFVLHRSTLFAVLLALVSAPIFSWPQAPSRTDKPEHKTATSIPMRDGVVLVADIRVPSAEGKFPVLIY